VAWMVIACCVLGGVNFVLINRRIKRLENEVEEIWEMSVRFADAVARRFSVHEIRIHALEVKDSEVTDV
jgi:hypothetical protein